MQNIMYRTWHKKLRLMREVLAIEINAEFGGVFTWGKDYVDYWTGEHEAERDFWEWNDIELMQYTGVHDNQGKPIFEGDIVSAASAGSHIIGVITWGGVGTAGFFIKVPPPQAIWHLSGPREACEVIGNVYQHSHLLESNV